MNCEELETQLDDYLDGLLADDLQRDIDGHLAGCESCARKAADARQLLDVLAVYPVLGPDDGFAEKALAHARRPVRAPSPRIVAGGFLFAFALSIFTVIYTGLLVEAPRTELAAGLPTVQMTVDEDRVVNLVFASVSDLDDVSLLVDLPDGVELSGYEGRRQVRWSTELQSGSNVLPLHLVAVEAVSGHLVARLEHGDQRKVFRVFVTVVPG